MSTRAALITLMNSKIISGSRSTTAQNVRDFETDMINSAVNKTDDADVASGYMKISSLGRVNISFINKATPTGQFLRDDGTWANAAASQTLAQVLATGNTTATNNIIVSDNDFIVLGSGSSGGLSYDTTANGILLENFTSTDYIRLDDGGGTYIKSAAGLLSDDGLGNNIGISWFAFSNLVGMFTTNGAIRTRTAASEIVHDTLITFDAPTYNFTQATASRLAIFDSGKNLVSADTATYPNLTEISYVKGVTSSIQPQLNGKEPTITAGTTAQYWRGDKTFQTLDTLVVTENTNLYFTEARVRATVLSGLSITGSTITAADSVLTAFGKLQNQINGVLGGAIYQGVWNANTNSPSLSSGSGTKGYYYVVSVAGATNLDGVTDWKVGDWAIFNGTAWEKVDNTDAVSSVNGAIGAVVITVTGTSNRIDVTGGAGLAPTIDISTSYVGQSSITTLGTITTGTWNATVIANAYIATALSSKTYEGLTITTSTGTLTIANGKTITQSNTLTYTGTDSSTVAFGAGGTVAYTSNTLAAFAATTSAQLAGVISDETGTGALVFAGSPTFTAQIITPIIYGSSSASGTLTIDSTSNATKGILTFGTAGASNNYAFNIGSSTAQFIIRERIGSATQGALYLGVTAGAESSTNYTLNYNGTLNINTQTTTSAMALMVGGSSAFTITPAVTGAVSYYTFAVRARTNVTTTANIPTFDVTGNIQTWATGTVAAQYFTYFRTQTAACAAASTFTFITSATIEMPTRGNNSTFTTVAGIYVPTMAYTSTTTATAIYLEAPTGATNNYAAYLSGSLLLATAGNGILIKEGTNATMGTATLVAGTVVVSTTKVTANSRIFLTTNGGTITNIGALYISARTAGTSFTITSANVLDASNVAWVIIEPG